MFKQISIFLCVVQILSEECKCQKLIDLPSDSDEPPLPESKLSKTVTPLRKYFKSKYRMTPQLLQNNIRRLKNFTGISRRQAFQMEFNVNKPLKKKVQTLIELSILRTNRTVQTLFAEMQNYRNKKADIFQIGNLTATIKHENNQLHDLFSKMITYRDKPVSSFISTGIVDRMMQSSKKLTHMVWQLTQKHNEVSSREKKKTLAPSSNVNDTNTTTTRAPSIFNKIINARHPTVLPPDNHRIKLMPPISKTTRKRRTSTTILINLDIPTVLPPENLLEHKVSARKMRYPMPMLPLKNTNQNGRGTRGAVQILSKESKRQKFIELPSDSDMVLQKYIPEIKLSKTIPPSRRYLRNKSKYRITPELLQNNIRRLKSMTRNSRRQFLGYKEFNTGKVIKKKVQTLIELNNVRIERCILEIHDIAEHYKKNGKFLIGYLNCLLRTESKQLNDLYDYMILNNNASISVSGKIVEEMINSSERISKVVQEMTNKHNELTNNSLDISLGNLDYFNIALTDPSVTRYTMIPTSSLPTVLPPENLHTKRLPVITQPPARKMAYTTPALMLKNSKIAVARAVDPGMQLNSAVLLHRMVTLYRALPTARIA